MDVPSLTPFSNVMAVVNCVKPHLCGLPEGWFGFPGQFVPFMFEVGISDTAGKTGTR